jgi:hypothetical protein
LILFHLAFFISLAESLGSLSVFSVYPGTTWQKFLGIYIASHCSCHGPWGPLVSACFSGDCDIHLLYFFFLLICSGRRYGLLFCHFRVTLSAWHLYGSADYCDFFQIPTVLSYMDTMDWSFYDNLTFYVSLILSFVLQVVNAWEIVSVARIKYSLCEFLHLSLIVDFQPLRLIV